MLFFSLVVRTWVLEGLVVPVHIIGASMAEAFYGPHIELTCSDCGFPFAFDAAELSLPAAATCPNCGYRDNKTDGLSIHSGDRLIIDKVTYRFRAPRRWEPILFRCGPPQSGYCIKRVVGLPGETVEIAAGDVWINGQRAQKNLQDLKAMAVVVHDTRYRSADALLPYRWRPAARASGWKSDRHGFHFQPLLASQGSDPRVLDEQAYSVPDWLCYQHRRSRAGSHVEEGAVSDNYGYNQTVSRELNDTADLYLLAIVEVAGQGVLALQMGDCLLQLETKTDRGILFYDSRVAQRFSWDSALLTNESIIEVISVDQQFLFAVDGVTLISFDCDKVELPLDENIPQSDQLPRLPTDAQVAIGVGGLRVQVRELRLLRDIYYTNGPKVVTDAEDRIYQLGEGEYFVLGDNSPISLDSRQDRSSAIVNQRDLLGKPWRWR
jgi:signal peptidase I